MNINILNAYCGLGSLLGPRLSQGRLAINHLEVFQTSKCVGSHGHFFVAWSPQRQTGGSAAAPRPSALCGLDGCSKEICLHLPGRGRESCSHRLEIYLNFRPEIRREYPLNLSILLSGGKETNKDSLSSGERRGKSPAPNPRPAVGRGKCGVRKSASLASIGGLSPSD